MAAPPQAQAPSTHSLITLLTDFGERDCFVASMKGVILSINSSAAIIDLSHQVASHQIQEAGFFLNSCYRYFPEGRSMWPLSIPESGQPTTCLARFCGGSSFLARIMGCSPDPAEQG